MKRPRHELAPRDRASVVEAFPHLRQSLLGDFDSCRLMTLFSLTGNPWSNPAQARGIIFHRFAAEFLQTLRRTGETSMPYAEALEILYEVSSQRDVPDEDVVTLTAGQRRLLRIAVVVFCRDANEFRMERLIDVERRLYATVSYASEEWRDCSSCLGPLAEMVDDPAAPRESVPTGRVGGEPCPECGGARVVPGPGRVTRVLTGRPDALVADPPDGAVVLDWKTTLKAPPKYEGAQEETDAGVSYLGYFQQRVYAFLVMMNYATVGRVTLREFYVLDTEDPVRKATVTRAQLEHVERELENLAEGLDRALEAGSLTDGRRSPLWHPSPGHHCVYCSLPTRCPIDPDERAILGGVTSMAQAQRVAGEYVVAKRVYQSHHAALKPIVAEHGPVPVKSGKGRYEVRWKRNKTGSGRTFGVHVPEASDRGPEDPKLADAFAEAAERKRRAA